MSQRSGFSLGDLEPWLELDDPSPVPMDTDLLFRTACYGYWQPLGGFDLNLPPPEEPDPDPVPYPLLTDSDGPSHDVVLGLLEEELVAEPVQEEELDHLDMEIGWLAEEWVAHGRNGGSPVLVPVDLDGLLDELSEGWGDHSEGLPARRAAVDLPVVVLGAADLARGVQCCTVCVEDYSEGERVSRLPCGHCFHKDCVLPWFESRDTCPVCRFKLGTSRGHEDEEHALEETD